MSNLGEGHMLREFMWGNKSSTNSQKSDKCRKITYLVNHVNQHIDVFFQNLSRVFLLGLFDSLMHYRVNQSTQININSSHQGANIKPAPARLPAAPATTTKTTFITSKTCTTFIIIIIMVVFILLHFCYYYYILFYH